MGIFDEQRLHGGSLDFFWDFAKDTHTKRGCEAKGPQGMSPPANHASAGGTLLIPPLQRTRWLWHHGEHRLGGAEEEVPEQDVSQTALRHLWEETFAAKHRQQHLRANAKACADAHACLACSTSIHPPMKEPTLLVADGVPLGLLGLHNEFPRIVWRNRGEFSHAKQFSENCLV